jgi:hypothetical protein
VERLDKVGSPDSPVVVGWQLDFAKVMRYSRQPASRYHFLLDWPAALAGSRAYVLDYHLMQAYRNVGYYSQSIGYAQEFLCSHRDFLVLDGQDLKSTEQAPTWFDYSIRNNPAFDFKPIDSLDSSDVKRELIAVHRKAPLSYCGQP